MTRLLRVVTPLRAAAVSTITGAGSLVYGVSLVYTPAAWILSGALLLAFGFVGLPVPTTRKQR